MNSTLKCNDMAAALLYTASQGSRFFHPSSWKLIAVLLSKTRISPKGGSIPGFKMFHEEFQFKGFPGPILIDDLHFDNLRSRKESMLEESDTGRMSLAETLTTGFKLHILGSIWDLQWIEIEGTCYIAWRIMYVCLYIYIGKRNIQNESYESWWPELWFLMRQWHTDARRNTSWAGWIIDRFSMLNPSMHYHE